MPVDDILAFMACSAYCLWLCRKTSMISCIKHCASSRGGGIAVPACVLRKTEYKFLLESGPKYGGNCRDIKGCSRAGSWE